MAEELESAHALIFMIASDLHIAYIEESAKYEATNDDLRGISGV
jgi:hypothetical protein